MDKNNILQFEADDASKTGINGKQVFFAKRINGKVTRNKELEYESKHIPEKEQNDDEELFIEFKNVKVKPQNIPQKNNTPKKNIKKKKYKKKKKIKRQVLFQNIFIICYGYRNFNFCICFTYI